MSKPETIKEWMEGIGKYVGVRDEAIQEKYLKTGLDGAKGQLASICFACDDEPVIGKIVVPADAIDFNGDHPSNVVPTEADLLMWFFTDLSERLKDRPPWFIGHFVAGFDLKFIFHRCVVNKINPHMVLPFDGRHNQHFYDTMTAWAGYRDTISQDNLCEALGIKRGDDIKGSDVWAAYKAGDYHKVLEHNMADVERNRQIYRRLTFTG